MFLLLCSLHCPTYMYVMKFVAACLYSLYKLILSGTSQVGGATCLYSLYKLTLSGTSQVGGLVAFINLYCHV